jgi:sugar (pentulose or hexulose) kinase
LGAQPLTAVYTAGGGAKNLVWQEIRQHQLQVPILHATHQDAAYGTALIAQQGINLKGKQH